MWCHGVSYFFTSCMSWYFGICRRNNFNLLIKTQQNNFLFWTLYDFSGNHTYLRTNQSTPGPPNWRILSGQTVVFLEFRQFGSFSKQNSYVPEKDIFQHKYQSWTANLHRIPGIIGNFLRLQCKSRLCSIIFDENQDST